MSEVFAVILAGGSGTRFWPASRRARPKQLLAIDPGTRTPLIAETVRRVAPLCPPARVLVATGAQLLEATRRALPGLPATSFLAEPCARNTAACIGWATGIARRSSPQALLMALPSDHHVGDEPAFLRAVECALESAGQGVITAIGIEPTRPDTGYGYIEMGPTVRDGVHLAARFVEKPDRERAEAYLAGGRFLWNSGMFFFRADVLLDAVGRHLPELAAGLAAIERAAASGPAEEAAVTQRVFADLPSISLDHGVIEKTSPLHVVPARFGWSDLGSWQSTWELSARDPHGNAVDAHAVLADARGNLVRDLRTDGAARTIALVGVEDLCVIETDDALLVIPRDRAQDVRLVIEALTKRGETERL